LLTATALRAGAGDLSRFRNGRQLSAWLGLTPREHSSGQQRRLRGLTKRGDAYLRTLLIHGARAVLQAARIKQRRGQTLDPLQTWALSLQARQGHNKAACALANKLARRGCGRWNTTARLSIPTTSASGRPRPEFNPFHPSGVARHDLDHDEGFGPEADNADNTPGP